MQEILVNRPKYGSPDKMIARLDRREIPYSIRRGSECTVIVLNETMFTFISKKNFPQKKMFLFNVVKKDVMKYLRERGEIILPRELETTRINVNYPYDRSIGIDLNHAYWRIAYIKGIISERTYNHGLLKETDDDETAKGLKAIRLASLSILGREKKFTEIEYVDGSNGERQRIERQTILQPLNAEQQDVFKYVRQVCFNMMHDISKMLGNDFECWKTDGIYFHDTPENRKLVTDYFDKKQMTYKILDYFPDNNEK